MGATTLRNAAGSRFSYEATGVIDRCHWLRAHAGIPASGHGDLRLAILQSPAIHDHPMPSQHAPTSPTTADGIA